MIIMGWLDGFRLEAAAVAVPFVVWRIRATVSAWWRRRKATVEGHRVHGLK